MSQLSLIDILMHKSYNEPGFVVSFLCSTFNLSPTYACSTSLYKPLNVKQHTNLKTAHYIE